MVVPIGGAPNPLGEAVPLFEFETLGFVAQINVFTYSPSADGQRFLINVYATELQPSLDVLLNWPASVTRRKSTDR